MKFSYKVTIDNTKINIADDIHGDKIMFNLYQQYGNLPVEVYNKDELWGNGGYVKPLYITTIKNLYKE